MTSSINIIYRQLFDKDATADRLSDDVPELADILIHKFHMVPVNYSLLNYYFKLYLDLNKSKLREYKEPSPERHSEQDWYFDRLIQYIQSDSTLRQYFVFFKNIETTNMMIRLTDAGIEHYYDLKVLKTRYIATIKNEITQLITRSNSIKFPNIPAKDKNSDVYLNFVRYLRQHFLNYLVPKGVIDVLRRELNKEQINEILTVDLLHEPSDKEIAMWFYLPMDAPEAKELRNEFIGDLWKEMKLIKNWENDYKSFLYKCDNYSKEIKGRLYVLDRRYEDLLNDTNLSFRSNTILKMVDQITTGYDVYCGLVNKWIADSVTRKAIIETAYAIQEETIRIIRDTTDKKLRRTAFFVTLLKKAYLNNLRLILTDDEWEEFKVVSKTLTKREIFLIDTNVLCGSVGASNYPLNISSSRAIMDLMTAKNIGVCYCNNTIKELYCVIDNAETYVNRMGLSSLRHWKLEPLLVMSTYETGRVPALVGAYIRRYIQDTHDALKKELEIDSIMDTWPEFLHWVNSTISGYMAYRATVEAKYELNIDAMKETKNEVNEMFERFISILKGTEPIQHKLKNSSISVATHDMELIATALVKREEFKSGTQKDLNISVISNDLHLIKLNEILIEKGMIERSLIITPQSTGTILEIDEEFIVKSERLDIDIAKEVSNNMLKNMNEEELKKVREIILNNLHTSDTIDKVKFQEELIKEVDGRAIPESLMYMDEYFRKIKA